MLFREGTRFGVTRVKFHQALTAPGIPCTPFCPHALCANPLYRAGGCRLQPCPVSEACIADAFWLPQRVLMADAETTRELGVAIRSAARPQMR